MSEAVCNASGLELPIVMTVANRAIGAPINIWNDHSDAMSQRDAGWIQLYAETNQEAADLHVQAFRIAEELPPYDPAVTAGGPASTPRAPRADDGKLVIEKMRLDETGFPQPTGEFEELTAGPSTSARTW